MKRVVLYTQPNEINDATSYYVGIVRDACCRCGYNFLSTEKLQDIKSKDIIFVITLKSYIKAFFRNPRSKYIKWFQGILPEESRILFKNIFGREFRYHVWGILERLALHRVNYILFVSEAMVNHYGQKYCYRKSNYTIMPCFNIEYNKDVFNDTLRYVNNSFVYCGSMSEWQCIDKTLKLFSFILHELPDSTLSIFTGEVAKAQRLIAAYGLEDKVEIRYVYLNELQKELSKFKFGLLLRDDHIVNNVATPTKFNSYLAAGLIPIYSDVIYDFRKHLSSVKYSIDVAQDFNIVELLERVKAFSNISNEDISCEFKQLFDSYYNREKYIAIISEQINKLI